MYQHFLKLPNYEFYLRIHHILYRLIAVENIALSERGTAQQIFGTLVNLEINEGNAYVADRYGEMQRLSR